MMLFDEKENRRLVSNVVSELKSVGVTDFEVSIGDEVVDTEISVDSYGIQICDYRCVGLGIHYCLNLSVYINGEFDCIRHILSSGNLKDIVSKLVCILNHKNEGIC